jgi:hypothetical protein
MLDALRLAVRVASKRGDLPEQSFGAKGELASLVDILPNTYAAETDFAKFLKTARVHRRPDEDGEGLNKPLSVDEKARGRYLRGIQTPKKWERFGARWGPALFLATQVCPQQVADEVDSLFKRMDLWHVKCEEELRLSLSGLTRIAKKHGDLLFPGYWKWLVNWEVLGGYHEAALVDDFIPELREWASGDVVHKTWNGEEYTEAVFLEDLEAGMWEFMSQAPAVTTANSEVYTRAEFAARPHLWARSGSSKRKESVFYTVDGQRFKAKRSKWNTALALDEKVVLNVLTTTNPLAMRQENSAIQKREAGKVRAVVNSDDETYLRMAYVSDWIERALHGHPLSTLYMSSTQLEQLWIRLSDACSHPSVKVPIDQTHFDWQQNKRMLSKFVDVLEKFIKVYAPLRVKDEYIAVIDQLRNALVEVEGRLVVTNERGIKTVIPVEKGVMSGWRMTALMDTVFNYGELYAARRLVRRLLGRDPVTTVCVQGDDDQLSVGTLGEAASIVKAYEVMNFELNPAKFFISTDRDEFLRQVVTAENVSGYPVRAILGLLWRNPVSRDPPAGMLRMNEQVRSWNLILARGGDWRRVKPHMLRDLGAANGLGTAEVLGVLSTPAVLGGSGFFNDYLSTYEFKPGVVETHGHIDISTVKGLKSELSRWRNAGILVSDKLIQEGIKDKLELSKAKKDVTPGLVTQTEPIYAQPRDVRGGSVPLQAPPSPEISGVLTEVILRDAVRSKNFDWIRNVYIHPDWRNLSNDIERKGGRRVWIDWVLGNLPWHTPVRPGWSDLVVGNLMSELFKGIFARVVAFANWNYSILLQEALAAEMAAHDILCRRTTVIGG